MTEKKATNNFEEEFAALPLEDKIASLLRLEAATLGETLTYIANSSAKAMEKAGEFINDMSSKIENEVKRATQSQCDPKQKEPKASAKAKPQAAKGPAKPKAGAK